MIDANQTHGSGQNHRNFGYQGSPLPLPVMTVSALAGKAVEAVRDRPEPRPYGDMPCRKCARGGGLSVRGMVRAVAGD